MRKNYIATLVLSGVIFGSVAGTAMVGVDRIASIASNSGNETVVTEAAQTEAFSNLSRLMNTDTDSTANLTVSGNQSESESVVSTVSEIAKQSMPSVVSITNTQQYQLNGYSMYGMGGDRTAETVASGSGVIIGKNDTELLIVSNQHVVSNATKLSVQFVDGESVEAEVKGVSSEADIALLAIPLSSIEESTLEQISIAEFGDSDALAVGDQVVAIGNALGYGQSVTTGIISAKDREISTSDGTESGLLQTDAAINPGNSGGALLNMQGQLIGINVAKYASEEVEGMGYSIPSSQVKEIVAELSERTTRAKVDEENRGAIGIQAKTVDSQTAEAFDMPEGVYVYRILEDSAADSSDLQEKDIIISFDGQDISSMDELTSLLQRYEAGETVEITVMRLSAQGEYVEKSIELTLSERS